MVKEGESGDTFFILTSGTCNVYQKNSKRESVLINQMRSGDHFGEKAIKNDSNTRTGNNLDIFLQKTDFPSVYRFLYERFFISRQNSLSASRIKNSCLSDYSKERR